MAQGGAPSHLVDLSALQKQKANVNRIRPRPGLRSAPVLEADKIEKTIEKFRKYGLRRKLRAA
jgi:hypothetical protein